MQMVDCIEKKWFYEAVELDYKGKLKFGFAKSLIKDLFPFQVEKEIGSGQQKFFRLDKK